MHLFRYVAFDPFPPSRCCVLYMFYCSQVVAAKVVTNARSPGSRCYGFVTMASAEEASKSIQNLHRTELHGRMISVEKVYMCSVAYHEIR